MPALSNAVHERLAIEIAAGAALERAAAEAGVSDLGAAELARLVRRPAIVARVAELRAVFDRREVGADYLAIVRARQRL